MNTVGKMALRGVIVLLSAFSTVALAQEGEPAGNTTNEEQFDELHEVIVTGRIFYRNRTETVAPELSYDQQFFSQFEPVSVGDQLKRVPGVAFTSDIGEYDSPQLRGLGFGFTQILINGRPIPGAGNDRTVFVDRIPAEIIDRIDIIRSPSADIDSQGIGGTINIILKDGQSLPPGVIARGGVNHDLDNDETSPSAAFSLSGRNESETVAYSVTLDGQRRFNRKDAIEEVFTEDSTGFAESSDGRDLWRRDINDSVAVERVEQSDERDSEDISFNGDLTVRAGDATTWRFDSFYLRTRRDEREHEIAFERDTSADTFESELAGQTQRIEQDSFGLAALFDHALSESTALSAEVRFARFEEDSLLFELDEEDVEPVPTDSEQIDSKDRELSLDASLRHRFDNGHDIKLGLAAKQKKRDFALVVFEDLDDEPAEVTLNSGVFEYEEKRLDAFVVANWALAGRVTLQTGVRGEYTETDQELPGGLSATNDTFEVNPSAHLRFALTPNDQLRLSVARTVRRPNVDQVTPFADSDEPEDDDQTIGNPELDLETSLGYDLGYERRLPGGGVFGLNFFYRDVTDLISLVNTGVPAPGGGSTFSFANTGDGKVYGFELDVSTPLSFIGLDETGFFANYTRLDSERTDPTTGIETQFNNQPEYVYNVGLTQNVPAWDVSFGVSYQKQGVYEALFFGEYEQGRYGANLEAFVEKRLGKRVVLRLSGNNLLDAASKQNERGYDGDTGAEIIANQQADIVDAFEIEREESSPTVTLTLRAVF
jgi:outer membrane receptor protein involved in Fe transport